MRLVEQRSPEPIGELNPAHIFAGAVIGDDWVQAVIMHLDPQGGVYPICGQAMILPVTPGLAPSLDLVRRSLKECWLKIDPTGSLLYNKFFLCLPPWCARSSDTEVRVPIEHNRRVPGLRIPTVRPRHVSDLEEVASWHDVPEHYVTVDLAALAYELDDGRRVSNPEEFITGTLGMQAHRVFADLATTRSMLNGLRTVRVEVDVMMSSHAAAAGVLSEEEMSLGTAVVDVGRRQTHCSFFERGLLRHTSSRDGGTEDVVTSTADRMQLSREDVVTLMKQRAQLLFPDDPNHRIFALPLFRWTMAHPAVQQLDEAAQASVAAIYRRVAHSLNVATREMMLEVNRVILVGDDPLTLRILKELVEERHELPCRMAIPEPVYSAPGTHLLGYARTIAFFREAARSQQRRQVYLERYNEAVFDRISRKVKTGARRLSMHALNRLVSVPPAPPDPSLPPEPPRRVPNRRVRLTPVLQ